MISVMDEYLVHQIESTVDHVASTDVNWQDRFYFNFLDRQGRFSGLLGYGAYPNRNIQEGVFRAVCDNKLYIANFTRTVNHDREKIFADGLAVNVVEPMKKWRVSFDLKDPAVKADLEFSGRNVPYEFVPIFHRRNGQVVWNQVHYTQAGSYTGSVSIGGQTFTDLVGIRDRSWGLRNIQELDLWIWVSANFGSYWLTAWHSETAAGKVICSDGAIMYDGKTEVVPIVHMEHDIQFEPGKRTPKSARYLLTDENGKRTEVLAQARDTIFVGLVPPGVVDLSDPGQLDMQDKTAGIFDQMQEFRVGSDVGRGLTEFLVVGGSEKYKDRWTAMVPR